MVAHKPYKLRIADKLKIKWLRHVHGNKVTDWEFRFLRDIKRKQKLSTLQKNKVDEIYEKYRFNIKNKVDQGFPWKWDLEDYMGDYDYIHDFDK